MFFHLVLHDLSFFSAPLWCNGLIAMAACWNTVSLNEAPDIWLLFLKKYCTNATSSWVVQEALPLERTTSSEDKEPIEEWVCMVMGVEKKEWAICKNSQTENSQDLGTPKKLFTCQQSHGSHITHLATVWQMPKQTSYYVMSHGTFPSPSHVRKPPQAQT